MVVINTVVRIRTERSAKRLGSFAQGNAGEDEAKQTPKNEQTHTNPGHHTCNSNTCTRLSSQTSPRLYIVPAT